MGINIIKRKLSEVSTDILLRIDSKFHLDFQGFEWDVFHTGSNELVFLKEFLVPYYKNFDYEDEVQYKGIPTGREYIDEFGFITGYQEVTKEEHPGRLKYKVDNNCILISSLKGAITPALNFDFDLSEYVFSNGFYIFQPKVGNNKKFFLYLLRSKRIKYLLDNVIYRGIGISAYREDDLLHLKIPKISQEKQDEVVRKINPIEKAINVLRSSKKNNLSIINEVFGDEFNIALSKVIELENIKKVNGKLQNVFPKNESLRMSFKWNRLKIIQDFMYEKLTCIEKLGKFIIETKNGWSPKNSETENGIAVLGQEHILKEGLISINPTKYTILTKNNIEDFFIKENDFFVSRGNTPELVALAGVVRNKIEQDIIYPDLYIKIDFDNKFINNQYMAYLFNSFIGRVYFKHVAKGKNQTMVKVSSKELLDFHVPLPELEQQQSIVEKIESQIDEQRAIDSEIRKKQDEISKLIEGVINQ